MELTHFFGPDEIAPGEGAWVFLLRKPISIQNSPAEQINHFYTDAYMAACNETLAHMYGFENCNEIIGAPLITFMPATHAIMDLLDQLITSGYKLNNALSKEQDKDGRPIFFLNKMECLFKDGLLIGGKGTQIQIEKP